MVQDILRLDYETFIRLDRSASLLIDYRLTIWAFTFGCFGLHFIEQLSGLWTHLT